MARPVSKVLWFAVGWVGFVKLGGSSSNKEGEMAVLP